MKTPIKNVSSYFSDGTRESSIVTKMFLVEEVVVQHEPSDDEMSEELQGRLEVMLCALFLCERNF